VTLRKTAKTHKGKTYTNYLLVESQQTPKGPHQRILCSLGALAPAPFSQDLSASLLRTPDGHQYALDDAYTVN